VADLCELLGIETNFKKKVCIYCKEEKPVNEFPKHSQKVDGLDTRCKSCIKKRSLIVNEIRKTAPPMTKFCECCGKKPNKGLDRNMSKRELSLVLDHDPITNKFRGWICDDCNKSIGSLGDTLEGVMKAVRYLEKFENPNG